MSYAKLFSEIVTSTIWCEDDATRIVWVTMLATADKNGEVMASVPGLARLANVPLEATRNAIETLLSPDPDSRTPDDEGRRIEPIDGGWVLLNYQKYRQKATDCDRAEKARIRQRRWRERRARNADVTPEPLRNADVTPPLRQNPQAEAEADTKAEHKDTHTSRTSEIPPCSLAEAVQAGAQMMVCTDAASKWWHERDSVGWVDGKGNPIIRWQSALKAYGDTWRNVEARNGSRGSGHQDKPKSFSERDSERTGRPKETIHMPRL